MDMVFVEIEQKVGIILSECFIIGNFGCSVPIAYLEF
jgi:hypothetical protein